LTESSWLNVIMVVAYAMVLSACGGVVELLAAVISSRRVQIATRGLTRMQTPRQICKSRCEATRMLSWIAVSSCAAMFAIAEASDNASKDVVIPTVYESGHFYSTPVLDTGKAMRMLLDTGGGTAPSYWINKFQAEALSLTADDSCEMDGHKFALAHLKF